MEITLKITVHDDGTVATSTNTDFGSRKHDLNASVIMIGAIEVAKNAILAGRFKHVDARKSKEE